MAKTKEPQQRRFREFKEYVLERLQDPEYVLGFLNASFKSNDHDDFLISLRNVVEARAGTVASAAKKAHLSRQNVYRMLAPGGNPQLSSLRSLLQVVGLELAIQPYKETASIQATEKTSRASATKRGKLPLSPGSRPSPAEKSIHAKRQK